MPTPEITAILLTDGGYLHRGKIVESPNATLKRFKGLIPDRHGWVQLRKIWEFLNLPDSFKDWYEASVGSIAEPRPAPVEATVSINSHWCQALWEYTKSDHYHPILK